MGVEDSWRLLSARLCRYRGMQLSLCCSHDNPGAILPFGTAHNNLGRSQCLTTGARGQPAYYVSVDTAGGGHVRPDSRLGDWSLRHK